jgi:hypothetical protein
VYKTSLGGPAADCRQILRNHRNSVLTGNSEPTFTENPTLDGNKESEESKAERYW